MATSDALRETFAAGRPLVEQWLDIAEKMAALRDAATAKGLDWSQLKALMKAQIQDERDDTGEGKRVRRIVEKAEFASAYADMLGLANMNENNFSATQSYAEAKGRARELTDTQEQPETANEFQAKASEDNGATGTANVEVPSDSMAGEVSRLDAGRTASATSERMDATAGETAPHSPSPANTPRLAADDEAAQANPIVVGTLPNPQPTSSLGAVKAPEVETPPPASGAALSEKKDCLKLKDGHCKISFDTPALCSVCNAERMKARAA